MSVTVFDRIQRADWLHIMHTFGDTEITVTHHDLRKWFTLPRHLTPIEMWGKAVEARNELVNEYDARRAVTLALRS
jgi:hypothetical protein